MLKKEYIAHNDCCAPFPPLTIKSAENLEAFTTDNGRLYKVGDRYLPSITTVLSKDLSFVPESSKRLGATLGTSIHNMCEDFLLKGEIRTNDPVVWKRFEPLIPLLKKVREVLYIEQPLYSLELGVAGRCDLVAMLPKRPAIIDFKSLRSLKIEYVKDYFLQLQAYQDMLEELTGKKYTNWILACTTLEDGLQIKEVSNLDLKDQLKKRVDLFYRSDKYKTLLKEVTNNE